MSSAAVSQAVLDLERDLGDGVNLFDRGPHGATLTHMGDVFLTDARNLMAAEDAARRAIRNTGGEETTLRVGWQPTLASIATEAVETLLRMTPHLRVIAIEEVSRDILAKVESGALDIGLAYLPPEKERRENIETSLIAENPLRFVASIRHRLSREEYVPLESLKDESFALPWLTEDDSHGPLRIRETIQGYFTENRFTPKPIIFQGSTIASVLALVRSGLAVTVLATLDVAERDGLAVRPLLPQPPSQAVGFIWRKDEPPSSAAEAFITEAQERIRATLVTETATDARSISAGLPLRAARVARKRRICAGTLSPPVFAEVARQKQNKTASV